MLRDIWHTLIIDCCAHCTFLQAQKWALESMVCAGNGSYYVIIVSQMSHDVLCMCDNTHLKSFAIRHKPTEEHQP